MDTGKEAWNPVRALSDLNEVSVHIKKDYSMYSPSRQCGGGKSQGEASLERKGSSGSFFLKKEKRETGILLCLEANYSPSQRHDSNCLMNVSE